METSANNLPPLLPPAPAAPRRRTPSLPVAEAVVGAALAAHKAGALDDWLAQHRRVARRLAGQWLQPVQGAAGETLRDGGATAVALLLRWAVVQLRPDRGSGADTIPR